MPSSLAVALPLLGAALLLPHSPPLGGVRLANAQGDEATVIDLPTSTYPKADPASDWITVRQWADFLESEAGVEFEYNNETAESLGLTEEELFNRSNAYWDDAVTFEWGRCLVEETVTGKACAFVLCHAGTAESGFQRKKELFEAVEKQIDPEEVVHQTIYNSDDAWCGFARMNASIAERIECAVVSDCTVTPLIMSMKMMPDTVNRMLAAIAELYKEEQENPGADDSSEGEPELPQADIYICPGVITEEYFKDGEDSSALDYTEVMTEWLLAQTGSADPNSTNATTSVIIESNYWTSSRAKHLREQNLTERGEYWQSVFELTVATTRCDDTFKTKLAWKADLRRAPDFSILTVTYNDTDALAIDEACAVALISGLATLVDVCALDLRPKLHTENLNAQWMIQSGGVQDRRPWFDNGLDGRGEVVAVSDTGIDQDNCYFWDKVKGDATIIRDDSHRKIVQYDPYVDENDYTYGHGTHVAGTVAGQRATDGINESNGAADGVAKAAKLAFIDIGNAAGLLKVPSTNYLLETGRTSQPQAHVHSASWGSVGVNYYSSQARQFDDFMFNNDDFLVNVAAGNDGRTDRAYTVSSPATFKNGISVGCSHSYGADLQSTMLGPSYVADFSSRGPTADGRMKPEIVAPGKYILSAGALPNQEGECDAGIPPAGESQGGLHSIAGTSMATPVVSGTAAQIGQYFREGWYPGGKKGSGATMDPSAALVKAVLLNGAQTPPSMKGVDNGKGKVTPVHAYDNTIGFGRIDLSKSLYIEGWSDVQAKVWDREEVRDGSAKDYTVTIDKSNGCTFGYLSVTLVWVEKASVIGCSRCVVNDLDLQVTRDGDETNAVYYPNGRSGRDDMNNAERVLIGGVQDKQNYTITVTGFNLDDATQSYALIATGCFGGVANTLDTSGNVFVTDTSVEDRKNTIIIIVCSVVGGLLACCLCGYFIKRRQAAKGAEEYGEPFEGDEQDGTKGEDFNAEAEA